MVVLVVVLWVGLGAFAWSLGDSRGLFGDMFGAANALFAGLAFATLIYTILLQRGELRLQRRELELTRHEMQGQREQLEAQKDQMEAQNRLTAIQGFETSFFQVLSTFGAIVRSIEIGDSKGSGAFTHYYNSLVGAYQSQIRINEDQHATMIRVFNDFYERNQGVLGHYFRTLYNLVKLVDRSPVEDKHFYTNLIRAHLSNQETLVLFYNCVVGHGREKFKPLVERYALLKNMPRERLLSSDHRDLVEPGAYGKEYRRGA